MSFYMRKKYFLFLTDFIGIKTDSDSLYVSYVTPVMSHVTPVMSQCDSSDESYEALSDVSYQTLVEPFLYTSIRCVFKSMPPNMSTFKCGRFLLDLF